MIDSLGLDAKWVWYITESSGAEVVEWPTGRTLNCWLASGTEIMKAILRYFHSFFFLNTFAYG